jgi:hypothetical protein
LYVYCMKTLDKYRKKKNLVIEDGCINLWYIVINTTVIVAKTNMLKDILIF